MARRSSFYTGRTVAVTGANGFLASHLIDLLLASGASVRAITRAPGLRHRPPGGSLEHVRADLARSDESERALHGTDFVFHLAAVGWGYHENLPRQPELLSRNLALNSTVIAAAHAAGVERYLYTSSLAVYPAGVEELDEEAPLDAPPHPGEACFGWAKRMGEIEARAYREHHGLPVAIVRPANPYGPRDEFDPKAAHVIPALIRRAVSGEDPFVVWGSGEPVRSFVHARDVARGMLAALEQRAGGTPINLGSPEAVPVADLVKEILALAGHARARVVFDRSKPDGPPRRVPRLERQSELIAPETLVPLSVGLRETIQWYRSHGAEGV